jgi:ABC-2 type transport system ATP-binding protein
MNLLSVKNLTKKYDDMIAVDNISFHVEKGDILGLVGPNGAGKSTAISMISGLLIPNEGEIFFEDNIAFKNWHSNIGLVPQDLAIYPDLSAEENVSFFAALYGLSNAELKFRVHEALKTVGLEDQKNKRVDKFSGGMKRRINIACAIAHNPKLIIMDEPTVGIDPQSRNFILDSIRKLQQKGTTIIYTSHYMEEVEEICNKILIIDHGKIVLTGTTDEIKSKYKKGKVLVISIDTKKFDFTNLKEKLQDILGVNEVIKNANIITLYCNENMNDYASIFQILKQSNINVIEIENKTPKLEEVFLSLTGKELRD